VGLFRRISQLREEQILSHAEPYLEGEEEVVHWVRAGNVEGKRARGFLYLTSARVVLHWTRGPGECGGAEWKRIEAWGVNRNTGGGPVLAIESEEVDICAQMPVSTSGMADEVRTFLRTFAENAPAPRRTLRPSEHPGPFESHGEVDVSAKRRSITEFTKRVLITVLGLILVIGGMLITPLPGPWSFPIIIAGLAVLATEYDWADDALDWMKRSSKQIADKVRGRGKSSDEPPPTPPA
jgi:uncharacterized protein (TIGR02611 family)